MTEQAIMQAQGQPLAGPQGCGDLSSDVPYAFTQPDGRVCWNTYKDLAEWLWLSGVGPNNSFPVSIDPGAFETITHLVSPVSSYGSGDMEVANFRATVTAAGTPRFSAVIFDSSSKWQYMNVPIVHTLIYGTATLSGGLAAPMYVPATQALQLQATNLEAVAISLKLSAFGRRFVGGARAQELEQRRRAAFFSQRIKPYWLGPDTGAQVTIAAGGSATIVMTTPPNGYFVGSWLVDDSDGDYDVLITNGATGMAYMDRALPRAHVFTQKVASVSDPGAFSWACLSCCPWTQAWGPTTQVTFQITNTSGAPNTIRIALHGKLVLVDGGPAPTPTLAADQRRIPVQPDPYAVPLPGACSPPMTPFAPMVGQIATQPGVSAQQLPGYPGALPYMVPQTLPPGSGLLPPGTEDAVRPNNPGGPRPILGPGYGAALFSAMPPSLHGMHGEPGRPLTPQEAARIRAYAAAMDAWRRGEG